MSSNMLALFIFCLCLKLRYLVAPFLWHTMHKSIGSTVHILYEMGKYVVSWKENRAHRERETDSKRKRVSSYHHEQSL